MAAKQVNLSIREHRIRPTDLAAARPLSPIIRTRLKLHHWIVRVQTEFAVTLRVLLAYNTLARLHNYVAAHRSGGAFVQELRRDQAHLALATIMHCLCVLSCRALTRSLRIIDIGEYLLRLRIAALLADLSICSSLAIPEMLHLSILLVHVVNRLFFLLQIIAHLL